MIELNSDSKKRKKGELIWDEKKNCRSEGKSCVNGKTVLEGKTEPKEQMFNELEALSICNVLNKGVTTNIINDLVLLSQQCHNNLFTEKKRDL